MRFEVILPPIFSQNLCNLRNGLGLYNRGADTSECSAEARQGGAARRHSGRDGIEQDDRKVMVYRPFSYLSATSQLPFS